MKKNIQFIAVLLLSAFFSAMAFARNYTVEFQNGKTAEDVEILKTTPGKIDKTISSMVLNVDGARKNVGAKSIKTISLNDKHVWIYEKSLNALVAPEDKSVALQLFAQLSAAPEKTVTEKRAGAKSAKTAAGKKQDAEEVLDPNDPYVQIENLDIPYQQRRLIAYEIKTKTGVLPWTPLDSEAEKERLAEQKKLIKEYQAAFPALKCYETRYFLFASDAPPAVYKEITGILDKMYGLLCVNFGIPKVDVQPSDSDSDSEASGAKKSKSAVSKKEWKNIWQAKCIVVVFMKDSDYNRFEAQFFENAPPSSIQGLCHQRTDGRVVITCKSSSDKFNFLSTLVHETTHGFTFMHKSAEQLPSWLSEGISDWCAGTIVKQATSVSNKQKTAIATMRQKGSLGGIFYKEQIDTWQYGAASLMVSLMLKTNSKAFIHLINDIKSGQEPQAALQKNYHVGFPEFARALGRFCGAPNLKP